MTLYFSDNNFKYEIEGVLKLFFPAQLFKHVFDALPEKDEGNFCLIRMRKGKTNTLLYVVVDINNKKLHKSKLVQNEEATEGNCELVLSRLLFIVLSEITGKSPKWGVLTGVRPVKQVNLLLKEGKSKSEIFEVLKKKYLCSHEKAEIAYMTAETQENILKDLDENSFSLYVSIPFCPTRCSYCSFVSSSMDKCKNIIDDYVDCLCKEIEETSKITKSLGLSLDTVYFGGGTPTSVTENMLDRLMKTVANSFDMSRVREYTVEAGRADTVTKEKLEVIKKNGASRVSINPQTLNDDVLVAIGRKHTVEQFYDSYKLAQNVGFDCVNTDIIAGLPNDTYESFCKTVDEILLLSPENITVHTLSIKRCADLNSNPEPVISNPAYEMVEYATKRLIESGYSPYYLYRQKNMVDNLENIGWSKPEKESLYNVYIMEEVQTIIAVGAGGSTKLCDIKNRRINRIFNFKHPIEYIKHFDKMIEKKNEILDFFKN